MLLRFTRPKEMETMLTYQRRERLTIIRSFCGARQAENAYDDYCGLRSCLQGFAHPEWLLALTELLAAPNPGVHYQELRIQSGHDSEENTITLCHVATP